MIKPLLSSLYAALPVTDVRGEHEIGGMRGHGYWYANEWISTDIVLALRYPTPPDRRCLAPGEGQRLWLFPSDYLECLERALLRDFPDLRRQR